MKIPRVVIAGTNSGCGKTTISAGLMAALVKKGIRVQPFKAGPDYIDPMFHTFVTGRYSRNLDSWLLDGSTLTGLFCKNSAGADISVVEGVMGLYDGFGNGSMEGSTAHISRILKCPVILVVNAQGMSLSAAALVKGFVDFRGGAGVRGVILNRISSRALYLFLKDIIEENTGVKVLGYIPQSEEYGLPERHLGLVPGGEVPELKEKLDRLAEVVARTVDLELLMKLAEDAPGLEGPQGLPGGLQQESEHGLQQELRRGLQQEPRQELSRELWRESQQELRRELWQKSQQGSQQEPYRKSPGERFSAAAGGKRPLTVRIAVAMDKAFSFYYRDNLELLEALGAELAYFSPVKDGKMPEGIDGLYLGGGYPEIFAGELSGNVGMRQDVRDRLLKGLPAYAECGGLMYLCRTMKDMKGNAFDMAGVFPAQCEMTGKLQRFGYVNVNILEDCVLGGPGFTTRAHEFHYSVVHPDETRAKDVRGCYQVVKRKKGGESLAWKDGWKRKNTLAGYPHIHFWSNPDLARSFIENCRRTTVSAEGNT